MFFFGRGGGGESLGVDGPWVAGTHVWRHGGVLPAQLQDIADVFCDRVLRKRYLIAHAFKYKVYSQSNPKSSPKTV